MEQPIFIPDDIITDDVICYIAGRYHVDAEKVVRQFLFQKGTLIEEESGFTLEENEIAILRDMGVENQVKTQHS